MARSFLYRCTAVVVAGVTAVCFGLVGQVSVQAASITNTGPDSYNSIKTIGSVECKVTNNNNVNVNNSNNQSATTGDVTVKHNTTVGGGWGAWDPAVWQAQGHTYEEWHTAFMNYLASQQAEWSANWGSLAPSGGAAMSGNASNTNSTNIGVTINNGPSSSDNGHACGGAANGTPGNPGAPGAGGSHGSVLGASTVGGGQPGSQGQGGQGTGGHVLGAHSGGQAGSGQSQNGQGSSSSASFNGGGSNNPSGSSSNPACGCQSGGNNTISNTGPDSYNSITTVSRSKTVVTNNNNVSVNNVSSQSATSGNVASSHNTTTSGGDSGDGSNQNGTNANLNLNN